VLQNNEWHGNCLKGRRPEGSKTLGRFDLTGLSRFNRVRVMGCVSYDGLSGYQPRNLTYSVHACNQNTLTLT